MYKRNFPLSFNSNKYGVYIIRSSKRGVINASTHAENRIRGRTINSVVPINFDTNSLNGFSLYALKALGIKSDVVFLQRIIPNVDAKQSAKISVIP